MCPVWKRVGLVLIAVVSLVALSSPALAREPHPHFTMSQILGYPYPSELTAAKSVQRIAWVLNKRGERNIWVADSPDFKPRRLTHYQGDNGQELSKVQLTPNGKYVVYVRGGDHDSIYTPKVPPDPLSTKTREKMQIWSVPVSGGAPELIATGDAPVVSPDSKTLVFIHDKDHSVWHAAVDGKGKAQRLFFDRGADRDLHWSPSGKQLAFVSGRGDHSFIGVYTVGQSRIRYLDPKTTRDSEPRWSPDGEKIAFVRRPGAGGQSILKRILKRKPRPWSIRVSNVKTDGSHLVWSSPNKLTGSFPQTAGGANLNWAAGNRLIFLADVDGWPHLYSVSAAGGKPTRLTTGHYMVEDVSVSPDHRFIVYNANTGQNADDIDRRHLYRFAASGSHPKPLTSGNGLEWSPVVMSGANKVAFIRAGAKQPPLVAVEPASGGQVKILNADQVLHDFPTADLIRPRHVTFKASDGHTAYGQLFEPKGGAAKKPAVIFVHGGPPRQMLLGWHYFGYYSNSYAVNQYLANHGYIVLSVNYRLGIGHGWAFHHPAHAGPAGASEYRDVLAGAHFLQQRADVDPTRIGIWGGSYGGYLTALALARNSDIFKAGSDWAGIHDWALDMVRHWFTQKYPSFETDRKKALKVAFSSSPIGAIGRWRSPVLLIQGDDDHNVKFHQTVDLANQLRTHHVTYKELVVPDEIHGFLRYHSWLKADRATVKFLDQHLRKNKGH